MAGAIVDKGNRTEFLEFLDDFARYFRKGYSMQKIENLMLDDRMFIRPWEFGIEEAVRSVFIEAAYVAVEDWIEFNTVEGLDLLMRSWVDRSARIKLTDMTDALR